MDSEEKKEQEQDDKVVDKLAEDLGNAVCPCCGKRTLKPPFKPGDDLMDQFMACAITGEPYCREYELYGGRARVTVSVVTPERADVMSRAVAMIENFKKKFVSRYEALDMLQASLRMYGCITRIAIDASSEAVFVPSAAVDSVLDAVLEANAKWVSGEMQDDELCKLCDGWCSSMAAPASISGLPKQLISSLVGIHMQLYGMLMETGFDSNFWSRIKLG